jgi:hypothetical protein
MGLIDQKKDIFTTIGAYTSMMQQPKPADTTNLFPSINNKKDVVPLLLDVLKVIVGSDALQQLTGQLFTKFVDTAEPQLKVAVNNQTVQPNSGNVIPDKFKNTGSGYDIKVKDVDINGLFKVNPNSTSGSMLFDKSKPNFNNLAYQAIQNAGTDTVFGNLVIKYNQNTDSFNFRAVDNNVQVGDFFHTFVGNMEIINKKTFITNVMNGIYGTIQNNQNKTVEQIAGELKVNQLIDQLINDDDSFIISPDVLDSLLSQAQQISAGVIYYDMGCGVMGASLPLSGLSALIQSVSGSTDPFFVGNQVNATISASTTNTPATSTANAQTVKDGFFQKLIKIITNVLAQAVCIAPQIRTLLGIISGFQNKGQVQIGNPLDDLKKFRVYLNCIIKSAMAMINKFIFDLIVVFLIALLQPVVSRILKEKINQYLAILKSLTGVSTG